jgi:hypothetical protein
MKRALLISTLVAFGLAGFAGSAAATPPVTPNGFVGACNMAAAWPGLGPGKGVGVQEGGGMENAMVRNTSQNTNGNDGMAHAVFVSGNGDC